MIVRKKNTMSIFKRTISLPHSAAAHFRQFLCVGNSQSANRGSERFEGNRHLRLQHNDHVRHQCPHLADAAATTDERYFWRHRYERYVVRHNDYAACIRTEGMGCHMWTR